MTRARRREQGGFALLVIFLIAAAVAFTMYQELPRAAFESARAVEGFASNRCGSWSGLLIRLVISAFGPAICRATSP